MMKKIFLLLAVLALSDLNVKANENKNFTKKWNLVWQEEFNGDKLDRSKWNYQTGNGFWSGDSWVSGWGNNEKEYYTDKEKNVSVKDGKLTISAVKENYKGEAAGKEADFSYTSGKIMTKDLFAKKYGRFEIRAKLPVGKGLWPAIWMLPQKDIYGGWAASGEIDIVEGWGSKPETVAGTLHYGETWPKNVHTGKDYVFKNSKVNEFHDYALEWEPGEIRWYVDGELYQVQNNWYAKNVNEATAYTYPAPFDQEFYFILNLAVGGWFDGDTDSTTKFPESMEIDYVRIYDLEGGYDENIKKPEIKIAKNVSGTDKNTNLISNGDFKYSKENWQLLSHFGGDASYSFEEINGSKFLKAEIRNGGQQSYSVQTIHQAPIIKGQWYKLSFDAKTENERGLGVKIGGGEKRGWAAYHINDFNLTNDIETYSLLFQMTFDSDENANIEFHEGLSDKDIWLGNVKLQVIENPEEEMKKIKKIPLSNGNLIYNGTFDQGDISRMQFWETNKKEFSQVKNRKLEINNSKVYQDKIQILKDQTYSLKLKASSQSEQKLILKLVNKEMNSTYFEKEIFVNKDFKEYVLNFKNDYTDSESVLMLEAPENKGIVVIDDVLLKKSLDYSKINKLLINEGFSDKASLKKWTSWSGGEYGFGGAYQAYINKDKAKLTVKDIGNEEWSNMFYQNITLLKGVKYRLSFDASSSAERDVRVVIENVNYQRAASKLINTDKTEKNVVIEFTSDRTEEAGLKFLLGKIGATKNRPHDLYLDNIKLEIVGE